MRVVYWFCSLIFILKFPSCKVFKKSDLFFWYLAHLVKQLITNLRFRISFTLFASLFFGVTNNLWKFRIVCWIRSKLYIPSTLNTDYLLWHTLLIVCAVIHGFKSWVIIFTFQVFWVKKHSKLTWKFRIKI